MMQCTNLENDLGNHILVKKLLILSKHDVAVQKSMPIGLRCIWHGENRDYEPNIRNIMLPLYLHRLAMVISLTCTTILNE